jgi:anti-sigma regulatory factor (Ser/Thr protein kinase)
MPIPGTVPVTGIIAPTSVNDTYPVTDPRYGLGGLKTVTSLKDRDEISTERRERGMIVFVTEENKHYILANGITNSDWTDLQNIISEGLIDGGNF